MGILIQPETLADDSIYGVKQVQYTIEGKSGCDFANAVTIAAFKQSTAIEAATSGYSEAVKARQKKIDDLGKVLSYLSKAVGTITSKVKSTDEVAIDNAPWIRSTCSTYNISFNWSGDKMLRGDLQKAQAEVKYQMDKEDNSLQQDIVTLQSYIRKRDNAYSTASTIVKKTLGAADATIRNIGT